MFEKLKYWKNKIAMLEDDNAELERKIVRLEKENAALLDANRGLASSVAELKKKNYKLKKLLQQWQDSTTTPKMGKPSKSSMNVSMNTTTTFTTKKGKEDDEALS